MKSLAVYSTGTCLDYRPHKISKPNTRKEKQQEKYYSIRFGVNIVFKFKNS